MVFSNSKFFNIYVQYLMSIIDICLQTQGLYLVKWAGWSSESNTWEPLAHLQDCCEKLKEFYTHRLAEREAAPSTKKRFLEVPPDPRTNFERRSELADTICPPPCHSELEAFNARLKTHPVLEWKEKILNQTFDTVAKSKNPHEKKRQQLREQIMLKHVLAKKKEQQKRLKEWEVEINEICNETAKITVENEVDFEGPPRQMTFISEYKPAAGIVIPDDPPIGCECTGVCSTTSKECCPENNGHLFPYTRYGKLRVQVGVPIYECNKRCKCASDCYNRVVQKGRKVKLCIYRTDNGCGWGVRTLENIKKGTFVVEYVGEVITSETAEERGKKYGEFRSWALFKVIKYIFQMLRVVLTCLIWTLTKAMKTHTLWMLHTMAMFLTSSIIAVMPIWLSSMYGSTVWIQICLV